MKQITIEARTTIYLIIAEKMFRKINKNDEKYTYGREALDKCWQWVECKGILADDLYELIDSRDCYDITEFAEDEDDMNRAEVWYALVDAVSYTIWQAYKNENAKYVPQAIEIIKDELIEDLIQHTTDTGFFYVECIEKLRNYLLENYLVDSAWESGAITKEEIMKMVDDN
ncbi:MULTISPECIES: Imm6 family immunity protein [Bacillus]|uniref:Imm6 family immunity protein n=1 Tax=Bacillus TaxID=1386 RepID=UPI0018CF2358|nr:Imm6 family immunity protein [Bacillus sp. UNC322MFChir4.1]